VPGSTGRRGTADGELTGGLLPERERVRLGAWLEEGDLERPLADGVVLAYELVHAAVPQQAVAVRVDSVAPPSDGMCTRAGTDI
jgi:hypothetical protein